MNQELSNENSDLIICEDDSRRLFNLTKLTAEELCLKSDRDCLIIRPSNVYGLAINSNLFLPSIVRNAINNSHIDLFVNKDYSKDYISVSDLVKATIHLSLIDEIDEIDEIDDKIINVASGYNISAKIIADILFENTGCNIDWHNPYQIEKFPIINISILCKYIDWNPNSIVDDMVNMITSYKNKLNV